MYLNAVLCICGWLPVTKTIISVRAKFPGYTRIFFAVVETFFNGVDSLFAEKINKTNNKVSKIEVMRNFIQLTYVVGEKKGTEDIHLWQICVFI